MLSHVLLFTVQDENNTQEGIYYRPQYGVLMEGITTNGSVREVAKNITRLKCKSYEPGAIDPGTLDEDTVINKIKGFILEDND